MGISNIGNQPDLLRKSKLGLLLLVSFLIVGCSSDRLTSNVLEPESLPSEHMVKNRTGHTATLISDTLFDKSVLFVGGGGGSCTSEVYRIDAKSELVNSESICRLEHTATKLKDLNVLISGGLSSMKMASETLRSAELFSIATREFYRTGDMVTARFGHNAILLTDDTVLITGGFMIDGRGVKVSISSAELYDPQIGGFIALPSMNLSRAGHTVTLMEDGSVVLAGGTLSPALMESYDPKKQQFELIEKTLFSRSDHTATRLKDGKLLLVGGVNEKGATLGDAVLYDRTKNRFLATGLMNVGRVGHTETMLSDGSVVFIGGNGTDHWALSSIEIYDPIFREFSVIAYLTRPRMNHTGTFIGSVGNVLISGGWGPLSVTGPVIMKDVEIFSTGRTDR